MRFSLTSGGTKRAGQVTGRLRLRFEYKEGNRGLFIHVGPTEDAEEQRKIDEVKRILDVDEELDVYQMVLKGSRKSRDEIAIFGRSVLGAFFYLSQSVDPPQVHEDQGLVTITVTPQGERFDWDEVTGNLMKIRSQASQPSNAFVQINYRGHWFYISDSDLKSKSTFNLLTYVFSLQSAGAGAASPLLTVPIR